MNEKNSANTICEMCGQLDLTPSQIHIKFNYGSKHDMESVIFSVCGECADKLLTQILTEREEML